MGKRIQAAFGTVAVAALAAAAAPVAAQSTTPWLHVRVEEAKDATKVAVNLPLSVMEAVLKASPKMIERHGRIHIGHDHGMKLADLRRVWKELAAVGDAELVTVESEDENVKVRRKGDVVLVVVDNKPRTDKEGRTRKRGEQVRVEVPVSLVDALLSGEGEEANIEAAVMELKKRRGDIVRVQGEDGHVRVWIDDQNTQPAAPAEPAGK
jgi:hypothetical protein